MQLAVHGRGVTTLSEEERQGVEHAVRRAVRLVPPLADVEIDVFRKHLLALPNLGKKLASKIVWLILGAAKWLLPKGMSGFLGEVASKAERYFLPYGFAALGVALQMSWVKLADFPKLIGLILNPTALVTQLIRPAIQAGLAYLHEALKLPNLGLFKA